MIVPHPPHPLAPKQRTRITKHGVPSAVQLFTYPICQAQELMATTIVPWQDGWIQFDVLCVIMSWLDFFLTFVFNIGAGTSTFAVLRVVTLQRPISLKHRVIDSKPVGLRNSYEYFISNDFDFAILPVVRFSKGFSRIPRDVDINCNDANMYQHVSTCINMYQHVSTCINMYQHVSTCINMYQHVDVTW